MVRLESPSGLSKYVFKFSTSRCVQIVYERDTVHTTDWNKALVRRTKASEATITIGMLRDKGWK